MHHASCVMRLRSTLNMPGSCSCGKKELLELSRVLCTSHVKPSKSNIMSNKLEACSHRCDRLGNGTIPTHFTGLLGHDIIPPHPQTLFPAHPLVSRHSSLNLVYATVGPANTNGFDQVSPMPFGWLTSPAMVAIEMLR